MFNSTGTSSVRVLPNNRVYRQIFEAQVNHLYIFLQIKMFRRAFSIGSIK